MSISLEKQGHSKNHYQVRFVELTEQCYVIDGVSSSFIEQAFVRIPAGSTVIIMAPVRPRTNVITLFHLFKEYEEKGYKIYPLLSQHETELLSLLNFFDTLLYQLIETGDWEKLNKWIETINLSYEKWPWLFKSKEKFTELLAYFRILVERLKKHEPISGNINSSQWLTDTNEITDWINSFSICILATTTETFNTLLKTERSPHGHVYCMSGFHFYSPVHQLALHAATSEPFMQHTQNKIVRGGYRVNPELRASERNITRIDDVSIAQSGAFYFRRLHALNEAIDVMLSYDDCLNNLYASVSVKLLKPTINSLPDHLVIALLTNRRINESDKHEISRFLVETRKVNMEIVRYFPRRNQSEYLGFLECKIELLKMVANHSTELSWCASLFSHTPGFLFGQIVDATTLKELETKISSIRGLSSLKWRLKERINQMNFSIIPRPAVKANLQRAPNPLPMPASTDESELSMSPIRP